MPMAMWRPCSIQRSWSEVSRCSMPAAAKAMTASAASRTPSQLGRSSRWGRRWKTGMASAAQPRVATSWPSDPVVARLPAMTPTAAPAMALALTGHSATATIATAVSSRSQSGANDARNARTTNAVAVSVGCDHSGSRRWRAATSMTASCTAASPSRSVSMVTLERSMANRAYSAASASAGRRRDAARPRMAGRHHRRGRSLSRTSSRGDRDARRRSLRRR